MKKQLLFLLLVLSFFPNYKLLAQQNDSIIKMRKEAILYEDPSLVIKPKPIDKDLFDQRIKDDNKKYQEYTDPGPGVPLKVTVIFIVDKKGNVLDPMLLRGIGFGFDEEALRLIKTNPNKWEPGIIDGKPVITYVCYQINFNTNKNKIMTNIIPKNYFAQVSSKTKMWCGTHDKQAREYFNSGNFGLENNLLKLSKSFFMAAVKIDPNFCDAWDNLSVCCKRMGLYEEAFTAGFHSAMIDTTNPTAWMNCGYAAFLNNDIYKALTSFDHLQRIIPDNPEGYYGKSLVLYAIDSISEAQINISKTLQTYKKSNLNIGNEIFLLKGLIEYKSGNKKEAQDIFEDIYSNFKDNAELNYFLSQCLLENDNNIKKSNKYFDRAKALGYKIDKSKIQNN